MKEKSISEKLKTLRVSKHLTTRDVAKALNIGTGTYSNYETGKCKPSFDILISICKYFNVSADYLLGLSDID